MSASDMRDRRKKDPGYRWRSSGLRSLKIAVEAAGGTMADVVKLNYFLVAEVEQAGVPRLRAIRDRYLNVAHPPASTLVVVSRLARPGWLIEIEAVAAIGG
jgi:enamine deaminase RidA (YjgF/YER057c/UK114 family)